VAKPRRRRRRSRCSTGAGGGISGGVAGGGVAIGERIDLHGWRKVGDECDRKVGELGGERKDSQ